MVTGRWHSEWKIDQWRIRWGENPVMAPDPRNKREILGNISHYRT